MSIHDAHGALHSETDGRYQEKTGTRPVGNLVGVDTEDEAPRHVPILPITQLSKVLAQVREELEAAKKRTRVLETQWAAAVLAEEVPQARRLIITEGMFPSIFDGDERRIDADADTQRALMTRFSNEKYLTRHS